jgi:hypothetical protein
MNILMTGAVGDVGQTLVARMKMVKLNTRLANTIICAAVPLSERIPTGLRSPVLSLQATEKLMTSTSLIRFLLSASRSSYDPVYGTAITVFDMC